MTHNKSVLVMAKAYPPVDGGVETYSQEVVKSYLDAGFLPTVITQTKGEAGWSTVTYPEGNVQIFNSGAGNQIHVFLSFLREARNLLSHNTFDFLHATTWRPALALLPFKGKTPLILTVHGREVMNYPWFLRRPMIHLLSNAEKVVTVSSATMEKAKQALEGVRAKGSWRVAFNGISYPVLAQQFQRPDRLTDAPLRILSLSRLVARKNIKRCIEALAVLKSEGLSFEYRIGGRGPMMTALQELVGSLGMEDCITFLGYVPEEDIPNLYQWADIFLHPQTNEGEGRDFEGFGLVIADAMSFGCIVIAGDAGGPKDFVTSETGILVDGTNITELHTALRRATSGYRDCLHLGINAKQYALSDLSWKKHVEVILS